VDLVFLLDSHAKQKNKEPDETGILIEIARVHALARGIEARFDSDRLRRLNTYDGALLIAAQMNTDPGVSPETVAMELRTIVQRFRSDLRAARRYEPGYYPGRVVLLRTSASVWSGDHGWSRLCANLEIYDVPGTHRTLLAQPNVVVSARTLREVLALQAVTRA
jgi:thioesterase domain-containing protein